jgi:hypothetical protein
MWTIGHISLAYILSRHCFGRKPLRPVLLLSIIFIAFVPDFLHHGILWTITHNMFFMLPFIIGLVWVIYKLGLVTKSEMIPLIIAGTSHIFGDVLFGSFGFYFPISGRIVGLFSWGSYLDYSFEIFLFSIMFIIMFHLGDLKNLKNITKTTSEESVNQKLYLNLILIVLIMVFLGQIGAIFYLDFLSGPNFYNQMVYNDGSMMYISILFILIHIIFVFVLIRTALIRFRTGKLDQNQSN